VKGGRSLTTSKAGGHQWSPWWAAGICILLIGSVSPLEKTAVGSEPPSLTNDDVMKIVNQSSENQQADLALRKKYEKEVFPHLQ
jgi:hypothetical protein